MTDSSNMPKAQNSADTVPETALANSGLALPDAAFNLWLERGLHEMFDNIADEPIPPALLALIANDRQRVA